MSIQLLICLLLAKILLRLHVTQCAPKLGGLMFEPILFEAFESKGSATKPAGNETSPVNIRNGSNSAEGTIGVLNLNITIKEPRRALPVATQPTNRTIFISEIRVQTNITDTTTIHPVKLHNNTQTDNVTDPDVSSLRNKTKPVNENYAKNDTLLGIKKMSLYKTISEKSLRKEMDLINRTSSVHPNGYNYDDTICRIVDDRVLCGYNKNPQPPKRVETVELAKGCRLRGDRIECGYVYPPFAMSSLRASLNKSNDMIVEKNSATYEYKRENLKMHLNTTASPSARTNSISVTDASNLKISSTDSKSEYSKSDTLKLIIRSKTENNFTYAASTTTEATTKISSTDVTPAKQQQHCVEKGDRIICYDVNVHS